MNSSNRESLTDQPDSVNINDKDVILKTNDVSDTSPVTLPDIKTNNDKDTNTFDTNKTPNRIDLSKALELRYKHHYTYQQIAQYFGVTHGAVIQRIQGFMKHLDDQPEKEIFDELEPHITRTIKAKYYQNLLDDKIIAKSSAYQSAYVIDKINNTQRLIEGKSTAILDTESANRKIRELQDAIRAYDEKELAIIDVTPALNDTNDINEMSNVDNANDV